MPPIGADDVASAETGLDADHDRQQRLAGRVGIVATVLNLIGLGLAIYLTIEHYSASPTFACPSTGPIDCLKVTTSSYAVVSGVPVALSGLFYFVVSLVLHAPPLWKMQSRLLAAARWAWVLVGMIGVFWLIYVELYRLEAICLYCTGVHIITFLLLLVTAFGTIYAAPPLDEDL